MVVYLIRAGHIEIPSAVAAYGGDGKAALTLHIRWDPVSILLFY